MCCFQNGIFDREGDERVTIDISIVRRSYRLAGQQKGVRSFEWSQDGKLLAYCNGIQSIIVRVSDWSVISRVSDYTTFFGSIPDGTKMGSFMIKGSTEGWEPHWTQDSNFILRKIGEQLLVYRAEPSKGTKFIIEQYFRFPF